MLKYSRCTLCFVQLASTAAAEFVNSRQQSHLRLEQDELHHNSNNIGQQNNNYHHHTNVNNELTESEMYAKQSKETVRLWVDDVEEELTSESTHRKSAAYKELHRPALTTNAMGLFGGEPGFEKAHRVWVDPDNPHMKQMFNQTALASNLRYTRYGYFKREMHLLDIDKLIRHARMLPTPTRLLSDFIYQQVPLSDTKCAALLRYQREHLTMLSSWEQNNEFTNAEEMFERMTVTNLPPVEVGVKTHAEMIRCCAVCKEWHKGFDVYFKRACEIEEEERNSLQDINVYDVNDNVNNSLIRFTLSTDIFDAVLELCVACNRPREGMKILTEVIRRHLRPRTTMLDKAMILVSIAMEQLNASIDDNNFNIHNSECKTKEQLELEEEEEKWHVKLSNEPLEITERTINCTGENYILQKINSNNNNNINTHNEREKYISRGLDVWTLYDFYKLTRTIASIESYMQMTATFQTNPHLVLEALSYAEANKLQLTLPCFYWALYAVRHVPSFGEYVIQTFGELSRYGLTPDYVLFTMGFMYAAVQKDGELGLTLYEQHLVPSEVRPTPEIILLILQSFASCACPRVAMLHIASHLLEHVERISGNVDKISEIYDQYLLLAAYLGAIQDGFSRLKTLVSLDKLITTSYLNSLLQANANAHDKSSGLSMTLELIHIYKLLKVPFNDDTLRCLMLCEEMYGTNNEITEWHKEIECNIAENVNQTLGCDVDLIVDETPPHRIRRLRCEWHIKPRDIMLKKYGQSRMMPKQELGVNVGGVVRPFGSDPGEKIVEAQEEEQEQLQ